LDESSSRFRLLFAHDLSGKPLRTFPDHALGGTTQRVVRLAELQQQGYADLRP